MKKTLQIKGMHCISCEMLLEKGLKDIKGVTLEKVSHKTGKLEIDYDSEKSLEQVKELVKENKFEIIDKKDNEVTEDDGFDLMIKIINFIIVGVIILGIYMLSIMFDVSRFLPDTSNLTFGSAFFVGIIASLSTCLAITGGIIIGFSRYLDSSKKVSSHIKVQSLFHVGRLVGFFIFGGLLGYAGSIFQISLGITSIFNIIIAILLIYMGLHIFGIVPSITKFGIHLPKSFASKIEMSHHPMNAPIVGALTFFLPCGFTQTMQLLAINSGSFFTGGLIMMIFALGTVPVLFSVGLGSSYFKDKKFDIFNKVIGGLLIFFGVFTFSNSYNLLGVSSQSVNSTTKTEVVENYNGETEIINIGHNGWETEPGTINLKAGRSYKMTITPSENGRGCMSTLLIPKLDSTVHYVQKGVPIEYEFKNIEAGKYYIVCSAMGMRQGTIIVE